MSQYRGSGADGGNCFACLIAVCNHFGDRFGLLQIAGTRHTAGQNDHFGQMLGSFLRGYVTGHGNAVRAGDVFSADADQL